jgi:cysteine sulfinate desulfinase/cysteine desulfurase-like protein
VALLVNTTARRVLFTGGGSEANNLAIKGAALRAGGGRDQVVTSAIEHPSVLGACRWLETQGFAVTYLRPDAEGRVRPEEAAAAVTGRTALVTVMLANNETGAIQPVGEIAAIARAHGALVHTDAVQAAGKIPLDVEALGVDLLTLSGHKFHGPKGVGVLFARAGVDLEPLVHGGGQERGLRSGTENLPGIAGVGRAAELVPEALAKMAAVRELRDRLERAVVALAPGARRNGPAAERLPNTLNVTLPGVRGESLVIALDRRGFALSSGSACHAGSPEPSHALLAMGLAPEDAHCAIRVSLGSGTTDAEVDRFLEALRSVLADPGGAVRFVSCR